MSDTSDKKNTPGKKDSKSSSPAKENDKKAAPEKSASKETPKPSDTSTAKTSSVPGSGSTAAAPKKAGNSGVGGFFTLIVILAVIGGGAYVTRDVWMDYAEPYLTDIPGYSLIASEESPADAAQSAGPSAVEALTDRVARLEQMLNDNGGSGAMAALNDEREKARAELNNALTRIDDLERRLDEVRSLATAMTSSGGSSIDLEPILSRIDSIEQSSRAATSEIATLAEKVETAASSGTSSAGQGAVLAVAQLRDAALAGRPYQAQLDTLSTVAVGNSELMAAASRLKDTAASGLPSVSGLEKRFADIAGDIVAQTRAGSDDWVDQALGKLSTLVSLRRTDGGSGNVVEDTVAEIASDLKGADVAAAAKNGRALYDALEPSVQRILEPWLLDAEARAHAERALDAMHASALAALGQ